MVTSVTMVTVVTVLVAMVTVVQQNKSFSFRYLKGQGSSIP